MLFGCHIAYWILPLLITDLTYVSTAVTGGGASKGPVWGIGPMRDRSDGPDEVEISESASLY